MNIKEWILKTLQITREGYYTIEDRRIDLPHGTQHRVVLYTPEDVQRCVAEAARLNQTTTRPMCAYEVNDMDTFGCAQQRGVDKCLVLNFADAFMPGGGFLSGLSAQEEILCRQSTLYASLVLPEARPLYEFNCQHRLPEGSDYLLVSPDVDVFCDVQGEVLPRPYSVDVITYAAPNLYDEAEMLNEQQVEDTFIRLIHNLVGVAATRQYNSLVLGAWGCGAFGNDAKKVAGYFAKVLQEEGYGRLFDKVLFAVYINPRAQKRYNYQCFYNRFMG